MNASSQAASPVASRATPFRSNADIYAAIPDAVAHLAGGGLLAYPTETVYGVGGGVGRAAVDALVHLKGGARSDTKPFLVLISDLEMVRTLGVRLTPAAASLAAHHWPGPLTLVLPPLQDSGPDTEHRHSVAQPAPRVRNAAGGVAVRWTSHAGMARLIAAYGAPITSTSANPSGVPPAGSVEEIVRRWEGAIARGVLRVLDGGVSTNSLPSTVVDCTTAIPHVVRAGAIEIAELRETVPEIVGDA